MAWLAAARRWRARSAAGSWRTVRVGRAWSAGELWLAVRAWLGRTARDLKFLIAGQPLQLVGPGLLALPWLVWVPVSVPAIAAVVLAPVLVLLAMAPALTAAQRLRTRSLLGTELPGPSAGQGSRWRQLRTAEGLRSAWQQLGYYLVVGPALACGAWLVLALWAGGLALSLVYVYVWAFPPGSLRPVADAYLTGIGLLMLAAAPWLGGLLTRLDAWACLALLSPGPAAELAQRVERLTHSRADVLAAADTERRRIERDLHDGAQQRLVSLAMSLGMARHTLPDLPEEARQVIDDAHLEAKEALAELRNMVRGLHPAVLEDRGLDAALSGIAARAPLPVRVRVDMTRRAVPAVEAVAYFIVSEALTNVARHAGASAAEVDVRLAAGTLTVRVTDDGQGGADAARGTGLASLARRAASVDGTMRVTSPAGGPTTISAELPCGS
ncbi:MAG TPA: sensor histidine kinase [Streptosporangiaceae bacterium]|nr:sensor histidine kinase [Streptosporangiaceae bacterium]